jgi:hypothetical protein
MTTTPRRFVIEDCDDHDRSRVVVCTINVHIVCLVESVVREGRQQERKPPQSAQQLTVRRSQAGERGMPRLGASGAPLAVTVITGLEVTTVGVRIASAP